MPPVGPTSYNMNWSNWTHRQKDVLTDNKEAISAESRLSAIKKAAKALKKSVEDSLRTAPKNRSEDLEARKRRTDGYCLGENVAAAVQSLNEERVAMNVPAPTVSPLNMILERFANLEKTIGHMQAVNESEILTFMGSDTPLSKLLAEEIPAVAVAKKDLEQLCRRQAQSQSALEKEQKKLDRLEERSKLEGDVDPEALNAQTEKRDRLNFELETLTKDVNLEHEKLTSTLLTLVSRENRYAGSVFELMRIKKQFYENAFKTIEAELPNIERILQETNMRPVFGERIEDHLRATNRSIAFPIALTVHHLLKTGLNDEGLFRISPKQIKLDKFKAHMDSHQPLGTLLREESDCHLHSSLLKSYLRELPVPLLGNGRVYDRWVRAAAVADQDKRVLEIQSILKNELSEIVVRNIQYVIKFLHELSSKSQTTKMTPRNISIVLGPTLLWSDRGFQAEQGNLESIISIVSTLVESYHVIFPNDIDFEVDEEDLVEMRLSTCRLISEPGVVPPYHPEVPPRPASVAGFSQGLSAEASPNHKRKSSIRSMGRNFMAKINVPQSPTTTTSSSASHGPSKAPEEAKRDDDDDIDDEDEYTTV